jgi:hypothetical protein
MPQTILEKTRWNIFRNVLALAWIGVVNRIKNFRIQENTPRVNYADLKYPLWAERCTVPLGP